MNQTVGSYILRERIGGGSFGEIFQASHKFTGEKFAAKVEDTDANCPQLIFESKIYKLMAGAVNVPKIFYLSETLDQNILIMELLGESLETLLDQCGRKMTIKTICMLAEQMISAIEFFHKKNYIHRDIKPDNFVIGRGKKANQVYIIDYGLAKRYRDPTTQEHISYSSGKSLTGTARYASINALAGHEQSRRDDMEGLAYVLIYLAKGELPWMGIDAKDRKEKYKKILEIKKSVPPEKLCSGLPQQFCDFLKITKALKFEEEPDYSGYKKIFRDLLIQSNEVYDYKYDWCEENDNHYIRVAPHRSSPKRRKNTKNIYSGNTDDKLMSVEAVRNSGFLTMSDIKDIEYTKSFTESSNLRKIREDHTKTNDGSPKRVQTLVEAMGLTTTTTQDTIDDRRDILNTTDDDASDLASIEYNRRQKSTPKRNDKNSKLVVPTKEEIDRISPLHNNIQEKERDSKPTKGSGQVRVRYVKKIVTVRRKKKRNDDSKEIKDDSKRRRYKHRSDEHSDDGKNDSKRRRRTKRDDDEKNHSKRKDREKDERHHHHHHHHHHDTKEERKKEKHSPERHHHHHHHH